MTAHPVFRYDPSWPKLRLFRFVWDVGTVGDGTGYSRKVAFALRPRLFSWERSVHEWRLVLLGVEIHSRKSYGGHFV